MDLSLFLNIAIILIIKPIKPTAEMAKVGTWIEYCIFIQIRIIKTMLSPTDDLPRVVFGKTLSLILLLIYECA